MLEIVISQAEYVTVCVPAFHKKLPDSKVHGANMEPPWVLSAPGGPHIGPTNHATRASLWKRVRFTVVITLNGSANTVLPRLRRTWIKYDP